MKENGTSQCVGGLLVAIVVAAGGSACSVATLQAGLEEPTQEVKKAAHEATLRSVRPRPIDAYEKFVVDSTDSSTISVYVRENERAVSNVLMVHGAGSGAWAWEIFFEEMPEAYNLYALNWRGHFDSSAVDDAGVVDYVEDQRAVAAAIALRNDLPIHIVGHSYGGATAILQASEAEQDFASVFLLAPVVPLDYTFSQRLFIPLLAPFFIERRNEADGTYGGMFLSSHRMKLYHDAYAGKAYSEEKRGLIAEDGVSPQWQKDLAAAYAEVSRRGIPVFMFIARYDNVVVPRRQRNTAAANAISMQEVESGHYIPLDVQGRKTAATIARLFGNLPPSDGRSLRKNDLTKTASAASALRREDQ